MSLPLVTGYTNTGDNHTLRASGVGSVFSLPNVTTITGSGNAYDPLTIQATSGGLVGLGALTQVPKGPVSFTADGTNSQIDLSKLAEHGWPPRLLLLRPRGLQQRLHHRPQAHHHLRGQHHPQRHRDDEHRPDHLLHRGRHPAGGAAAAPDFGALPSIDGQNISVDAGGTLSLPLVTGYTNTGDNHTLRASGVGSVLSLPNVTTITGSGNAYDPLTIQATSGGLVGLGALTQVPEGPVSFTADGTNSQIDLSSLQSMVGLLGYYSSGLAVSNSGSIIDPKLTTISAANITLNATGMMNTAQITSYTGGGTLAGGRRRARLRRPAQHRRPEYFGRWRRDAEPAAGDRLHQHGRQPYVAGQRRWQRAQPPQCHDHHRQRQRL